MIKKSIVTLFIIFGIILLVLLVRNKSHPDVEREVVECIGQNSILYIQLGCSHCKTQEEIFGDNYQYLNVIDCFFEHELCGDIEYTPTWIINKEKYTGVQTVDKLKELTGC
ncbi:MAG: DsbA family protein [Candidatus Pacearchaeota archaeon]|nr:DsbA family protein [Candidatus Pacearchaeota archaeon]